MTPKQILDSFSETLMWDERILSAQERSLLATLLQHAKAATTENDETGEAVRSVIASAVGETVAQRAFTVLGRSIVERIIESSTTPLTDSATRADIYAARKSPRGPQSPGRPMKDPETPGAKPMNDPETPGAKPMNDPETPGAKPMGDPETPGVRRPGPMRSPMPPNPDPETPGVREPRKVPAGPMKDPMPPNPDPETPGHGQVKTVVSEASVAVADRPAALPARCVVLDEFLAPQEVEELTRFTLAHEPDFRASEVVSPHADGGIVNYEHRRSRVLMELEQHESIMLSRIRSVLPQVLQKLGMEDFRIDAIEAQITASNDGDFFCFHSDNASQKVRARHLTFVYFFHREPRPFGGGELRIHDARLEDGVYVSEGSYQTIVPQQNQIVFFQCELMHEITPVKCPSRLFADSRFTLNGWLRQ